MQGPTGTGTSQNSGTITLQLSNSFGFIGDDVSPEHRRDFENENNKVSISEQGDLQRTPLCYIWCYSVIYNNALIHYCTVAMVLVL